MFERFKKKKKKEEEQMPIGEALDKIISGEQTGQAEPRKISQDLDRVISEIQPERKPSIKPQTEQEEQKPRAKPVDMMEEERKGGADYAKYGKKYAKAQSFIQNIRPIRKAWDAMVPDTKYGKAFRGGEIETSVISGSALKWLGSEVNSEKIKSFAEGYRQEHLGELERKGLGATGEEGRIEQTIRATPLTLSQVSVAIFAGITTGGPIGAKAVGGLSMGALEGGGAYQEAIDRGATEDQAQVAARITGSINGAIEVAIPWNILNSTIGKVLPKTVLKKAKKEISKNIAKQVLKKTGKFAVSSLKQAAGEGAQEYVQEVVSNLAARYAYDPSQSWNENARGSGEVGALMGLMFSFVPGVGGRQLHIQEQAEQPPKPLEQEPAKEPASQASENVNKTFGLLAEDDKEALTELLPKMSQEEILEVRDALVKMERQGKKDALEDRKMIEDILIDRETKSSETAKKILKEGKLESLEELPLEDRKKVIGAVEKTKDETAVGEITKEREKQTKLKEEKTKLLAERKAKPEQKKEIQAKIDKIDEQRRDEFVFDDVQREAAKALAERIKEEEVAEKKTPRDRAKEFIKNQNGMPEDMMRSQSGTYGDGVGVWVGGYYNIGTRKEYEGKKTPRGKVVVEIEGKKPEFFSIKELYNENQYEHKQKTTTKPKGISEPRKAGKPEPKKVSDKTAEAREKQPIGRRVEEDGVLIHSLAPDKFALEDKEGTPVMSLGVAETAKTKLEKEFKITIKKVKGRKDSYNVFAEKKEVEEVKMTEEEYLNSKGASRQGFGEAALHKNIQEGRAKRQALKRMSEKDEILTEKREKLRVEYAEKVKAGKIKTPTRIEQLINTAQGTKENKATQAARRLLRKKGISWESEVKKLKAKKKTYIEDRKKFVSSFIDSAEGEKAYQAVVEKEARLGVIGETDKTVISGIKNNSYYRKEKTIKDAMGNGHLLKKGNRYMIAEPKDLDRFVRNGWENVIEVDTLANEAGFASGEDYLNYTLEQLGNEESLSTLEKEAHKILMEKDVEYIALNNEIDKLTNEIKNYEKEKIGEIADIEKKETRKVSEKYQKMTARELALDVQYSGQYEYVNKKWQLKPVIEEQISSKEAIKIFRQFFTKEEMPIEVVERITTEDGGGAWASVTPELVKFIQNPKESTPYHEAVHAYLNKYATKKQWGELMSEVKKEKYGEKTEAEITNAELEEDLAEDFIGYVKNRKAPSSNIIKRFYDDVIKFLKKLIGKENKIEAFYEAIIEKKRPGYLQKTKLLLGKLRERELLYQRKRSKEYVEALKAMSKRDTKSFEDITEITDKAAFNSYFRKDINWIEELFAQSRDIYLKDKKEFVAAKMFEDSANDRRMNKSDMDNSVSKLLKPYYDLNKKSQDKLNRVLMHGDMEGKKYNKTELAELGIITKEEITAYYNIRKSFEKVLDTIVEKMREVGVSEDEIADFQRTKIGYMPHKWEHKFVVKEQKQDADGNWQTISMEDFAKKKWSMKAWIERKRQNKREDIRYVPGTLDSIDVDFFTEQRLSFENFKSIIENAKAPEDMKKTVLEAIKNMVKEKGFGRHFIRRTGVEGYDMNRTPVIIADYFSGFSGYITKMEASPKYFEALEKIDPVKQKKFYRWMRNTIAYDMGNAPEYNEIKTLAFTYYLANDISFLATNATQNFTVGIGELSKLSKGGKKVYQPEQKLLAANKDWWTQNISEEEKASVKKLLDEGRLGAEMTGELMGFKNNPLYRSVSRNLNSALFSTTAFVERNVNRVPAFLAARRILESQGITGEELNKQALDKSDDIHFRYGKQHRPMLYRKYGGPVFVFTHYIRSFMFQLSRDVKHREFVSLGRKMFYTSFFGGLTALPFAKLIVETWKEIVGDWDDDDESKEEVSRWETMVKKGVPASFGVDMSGRVSIDIFALENIKDDPKNITKWVGAAGGLIVRGHQGYEMVRQGRYIEASGKLLPDFAGNPFRGYYGYEYGVRSFGGVPLETKDEELFEYSFSEALTKGVGFSPTRETALYEKIREERKKKDKKSKKRKRLKMKIEDAKRRGDYKKRRELKRELRKLE